MSDQKTFNAIWCAAITALPRCKAVLVIIVYTPMRQMELKKSAELTLVIRWISAAVGGDFHSGFPNVGNILSRNNCEVNKSADAHCADNVAHAAPRKPYEGTSKKSPMTLSPAANAKIFNGVLSLLPFSRSQFNGFGIGASSAAVTVWIIVVEFPPTIAAEHSRKGLSLILVRPCDATIRTKLPVRYRQFRSSLR